MNNKGLLSTTIMQVSLYIYIYYIYLEIESPAHYAVGCFLFQPVLHNWWNKGDGIYYSVCWMVVYERFFVGKSSPRSGSSVFPRSVTAVVSQMERVALEVSAVGSLALSLQ